MDTDLIEYINGDLRTYLKAKRDSILNSLCDAIKDNKTDGIKIDLMGAAQWIRADMELLFRTVFWANLSEEELRARIQLDQMDILQRIKRRLDLKDDKKVNGLLTELKKRPAGLPIVNKRIEDNREILNKIIWHQKKLKTIYGAFYVFLTKFAHPDPYFSFLGDVAIAKEGGQLIRLLSLCAKEIDREWFDLKRVFR